MNNRQIIIPLVTRTGLHVGSGAGDATTDALIRRDAHGNPVIPGTALAGALRTLATRLAPRLNLGVPLERTYCKALVKKSDNQPCGCIVCKLFGDINPGDSETAIATAAHLWVYDAHLVGSPASWVQDGVGIDRETGAAYRQGSIKFDMEVLPPSTKFTLRLELAASQDRITQDAEERLLAAVLAEWKAGRGVLGGRVSRGLGAIEIRENPPIEYRGFDFENPQDLYAYLSEDDPWGKAEINAGWLGDRLAGISTLPANELKCVAIARSWAHLTVEIQADGPFLINDPVTAAESGFDHAPFLAGGDRDKPLLPGASLKGVLRSQAERVARTLATHAVWNGCKPEGRTAAFLLRCPACSPLVANIDKPLTSCDTLLQDCKVLRTTDEADDDHLCLACRLFGSTRRGSRLRVEDAILLGKPIYKPQDFLAIDRFTGGGAEKFKFDALTLWQPRFKTHLFLENPEPWELGWLLLTLRDVQDGLATLGFGASKGFGQVHADTWHVELGYLAGDDAQELHISLQEKSPVQDGVYTMLHFDSVSAGLWRSEAQAWVREFVDKVNTYQRDPKEKPTVLPKLAKDSYFGNLEDLYPVKEMHNG